jgi:hypothetical protein
MRLALEAARRGCVIDGAVFELEESDAETWRAIAAAAVPAARASASAAAPAVDQHPRPRAARLYTKIEPVAVGVAAGLKAAGDLFCGKRA